MLVIPTAGPAANQVPDTSELPGVESSGPQKLALSVKSKAKIVVTPATTLPTLREIDWLRIACNNRSASIKRRVGPAGLEPATVGL
jgi:hypothetical protein